MIARVEWRDGSAHDSSIPTRRPGARPSSPTEDPDVFLVEPACASRASR